MHACSNYRCGLACTQHLLCFVQALKGSSAPAHATQWLAYCHFHAGVCDTKCMHAAFQSGNSESTDERAQ